ncbi:MAG: hypothetical protein QOK48_2789, partial [Blastocatellia bacterium]|nr:hypothetical protein [Blastocatellia bacterium]
EDQAVATATGAPDRNETTAAETAQQTRLWFGYAAQGGQSFIRNYGQMPAGWDARFLGGGC